MSERIFGETPSAWLFVLPAVVVILGLNIVPMAWSFLLSFKSANLVTPARWIGLTNYRVLFEDPAFRAAVEHTLIYTAIFVPTSIVTGLAIAVMLNRRIRFIGVYRTMMIVPYVISFVAQGVLFSFIFDAQYGVANGILNAFGVGRQGFLQDPGQALYLLPLIALWAGVGFCVIIYLAALQDVSPTLLDAASVDGAGRWSTFYHVVLPTLRPVTIFLLLWQTLLSLQLFDLVYVMTNGGPVDSTTTIVFFVFHQAFVVFHAGYGAASAYLLGLALLLLGIAGSLVRRMQERTA